MNKKHFFFLLLVGLISLGCTGQLLGGLEGDGGVSPDPRAEQGLSFGDLLVPWSDAKTTHDGSGAKEASTKPDTSPPPPPNLSGKLPTFVNLDWNAFPKDPGPNYQVQGKTWVVDKGGSDGNSGTASSPFKTINRALSAAQPGDLVRVNSGSYTEGSADGYRALVLSTPKVVLTAAPGATVTVVPASGHNYGVAITASNVVLNGIDLQGFKYSIQVGSDSSSQKNVVISNLKIQGKANSDSEGINAYHDTHGQGFATSDGLLIKNVSINNVWMGISCNSGPCHSWRLERVKIVGQGGSGSGADAIAVEDGDNLLFYGVEVTQVAADGIDTKATRVVVWDCHVHHVARNGVKLWHGGDIVNTLIHHTAADAAVVTEQGPKVRLLHSLVAFHNKGQGTGFSMTFGYDSQASQTVEIINSVIGDNNGGIYFNGASSPKIQNSVFYNIDNGLVFSAGGSKVNLSDGPGAIKSLGLGDNNLFSDPQLSSAFHLGSSSPAINKGVKLSSQYPALDHAGKARVKSNKPDPGPFEDH